MPLPFRFQMNFRILRHNLPHLGHFFSSISSFYFPVPQVGKTSHRSRKQKAFFNFLQNSSADFGGGVPYPLCTPNSNQGHPRLKDSAVDRAFYSEILSTRGPRHARSSRDGVECHPRPWSSDTRSFRAVRSKPESIRQRVAPA